MDKNYETVYIGLGSNMGDRQQNLFIAVNLLRKTEGILLETVSPVYETKPVGYTEQPYFLNCAVKLKTRLTPYELLDICKRIEKELKRSHSIRWGPRTIDLDILFFGSLIMDEEHLTIPHPSAAKRGFVLFPMMDLAPGLLHPTLNLTISELLEKFKKDTGETNDIKPYG